MKNCLSHLKKYQVPLLAGVFIGTSYIPFTPWAIFFGFSFLWFFLYRESQKKDSPLTYKQVFFAGWITQFTLTVIGFHWIAHTAHEFGQIPWILAIPVLIIFATLIHIYIPISAVIWWFLQKRLQIPTFLSFITLGTIHFLMESFWPSIFPWNLGYPWLWANWPGAQNADVIGFQGLSFITYMINTIAVYIYWQRKHRTKFFTTLTLTASFFVAFQFWGLQKENYWTQKVQTTKNQMSILQIQANIGNLMKVYAEQGRGFRDHILNKFMSLTKKGLYKYPDTDLVLWPETAFPDNLDQDYHLRQFPKKLKAFVHKQNVSLITGGYSQELKPNQKGQRESYNSLFHFGKNGALTSPPYRKHILLAWGEYIPFGDFFPFLYNLIPSSSEFGKGIGAQVFSTSKARIGPQICYEGLDPLYVREIAEKGAEIFINHTNDSWFGKTFEPHQHAYMTMARAIEFRRPLVRNTNTGISTAILANGAILQSSPVGHEWFGSFQIPYNKNPKATFYQKYGYQLPWWILIIFISTILIFSYKKIYRSFNARSS